VIVAARYCGPPGSANGGYACGRFASIVDGDAEVTLRLPPPLDTPFRVVGGEILDGDRLIAEVQPTTVDLELPEPVGYDEARALERPADHEHPFPTCFVCGPEGDGLRLRPSAAGEGRAAAAWQPAEPVTPELVWAALDCPGAFAVDPDLSRGATVLGRLAVHIEELPRQGDELVVVGWDLGGAHGRRSYAGTALFRGETALAWGRATWFSIPSGA
jgi:hypothetical protein